MFRPPGQRTVSRFVSRSPVKLGIAPQELVQGEWLEERAPIRQPARSLGNQRNGGLRYVSRGVLAARLTLLVVLSASCAAAYEIVHQSHLPVCSQDSGITGFR